MVGNAPVPIVTGFNIPVLLRKWKVTVAMRIPSTLTDQSVISAVAMQAAVRDTLTAPA
jgi:hypothetical protein